MTLIKIIKSNMNVNGGGLAVNITGRYESNRHAIAKIEKVTFGDCVKFLKTKKGGNLNISAKDLLSAWFRVNGEPEWHHAGFLPKSYGGGMKKTYFMDNQLTAGEVATLFKINSKKLVCALKNCFFEQIKEQERMDFLNKFGKKIERKVNTPEHFVVISEEMDGKYGWFAADSKYNMTVYYSGYEFESAEKRREYLAI